MPDLVREGKIVAETASPLQSLPPELLFTIFDFLSGADLACLKIACRFFYALEYRTFLNEPEAKDFYRRFQADLYSRICREKQQRPWILRRLPGARLPCSVCRTTHPRSQFSSDERQQDDSQRACLGALGLFRMCPCTTITFVELKSALEKWLRFDCLPHSPCRRLDRFTSVVRRMPMGVECQIQIRILRLKFEPVNPDDVRIQLEKVGVHLCPHLSTSSPYVFKELYKDALQTNSV